MDDIAAPQPKRTRTLTVEDIERRIAERHGTDKLELVSYAGTAVDKNSEFRCLTDSSHRTWMASAGNVIHHGNGCRQCAGNQPLAVEDIERRILEKHGPEKLELVSYAGNTTSRTSEFRCLTDSSHGTWKTSAGGVISNGNGCRSCAGSKPLTAAEIERRILEKHGPAKFELASYAGTAGDKNSEFRCIADSSHGKWSTSVNNAINGGCRQCAGTQALSVEDIERRIVEKHGPEKLELVFYAGKIMDGTSEFRCLADDSHPAWKAYVNNVINVGSGCPSCAKSGFNHSRRGVLYLYLSSSHLVYGISNRPAVRTKVYTRRQHKKLTWLEGAGSDVDAAESFIIAEAKRRSIKHSGTEEGEINESLLLAPESLDLFFEAATKFGLRPVTDSDSWSRLAKIRATEVQPGEFESCSEPLSESLIASIYERLFSSSGSFVTAA